MPLCDVCALEPPSRYCCEGQADGCALCSSCYHAATRVGKRKRGLLLGHRLVFRPRWLENDRPAYSGRFCPASLQSRYWPWRRQRAGRQRKNTRAAFAGWRETTASQRACKRWAFVEWRDAMEVK